MREVKMYRLHVCGASLLALCDRGLKKQENKERK